MSASATEWVRAYLLDSEMEGVFEEALNEATAEEREACADMLDKCADWLFDPHMPPEDTRECEIATALALLSTLMRAGGSEEDVVPRLCDFAAKAGGAE